MPVPSSPLPATQREAGEGQGREHAQWQEERSRDMTSSTWEQVLSRKGPGVGSDPRIRAEEEIEKKWAEFERLPLKEMRSLLPMGSRSSHPANEALQREVVHGDVFQFANTINKCKFTLHLDDSSTDEVELFNTRLALLCMWDGNQALCSNTDPVSLQNTKAEGVMGA